MSLKQKALNSQLRVIRDYIEEKVESGSTYMELFDWEPGCGNCSIFPFRVTKEHLEKLQVEMDFTFEEERDVDTNGMLWWKTEHVYLWYTITL